LVRLVEGDGFEHVPRACKVVRRRKRLNRGRRAGNHLRRARERSSRVERPARYRLGAFSDRRQELLGPVDLGLAVVIREEEYVAASRARARVAGGGRTGATLSHAPGTGMTRHNLSDRVAVHRAIIDNHDFEPVCHRLRIECG
jgi:hypothetical protein